MVTLTNSAVASSFKTQFPLYFVLLRLRTSSDYRYTHIQYNHFTVCFGLNWLRLVLFFVFTYFILVSISLFLFSHVHCTLFDAGVQFLFLGYTHLVGSGIRHLSNSLRHSVRLRTAALLILAPSVNWIVSQN